MENEAPRPVANLLIGSVLGSSVMHDYMAWQSAHRAKMLAHEEYARSKVVAYFAGIGRDVIRGGRKRKERLRAVRRAAKTLLAVQAAIDEVLARPEPHLLPGSIWDGTSS
jgi:hypothetical protein